MCTTNVKYIILTTPNNGWYIENLSLGVQGCQGEARLGRLGPIRSLSFYTPAMYLIISINLCVLVTSNNPISIPNNGWYFEKLSWGVARGSRVGSWANEVLIHLLAPYVSNNINLCFWITYHMCTTKFKIYNNTWLNIWGKTMQLKRYFPAPYFLPRQLPGGNRQYF